ncbi:MAG: 2-phospho-L-lactate transferase [Actinobacteria bacterium]|nr:2-phospho-L-lactate transferase [Actinomycetota bacterium]MBM3697291.1 2-phospho-L-lactate transferase [Actinomycetota bacterium]
MIVALAGGTGGSKMVHGLALAQGQRDLAAIVNTGDDGDFFGLLVCPDLDINLYCLAGVVADRGWGYADDTFRCLEGLATYGREAWFGLGDRDLATHVHRTLMMRDGARLSDVVADLRKKLGVEARVLPMTDDPVRTIITTQSGERRFQEYLVRDGSRDEIESIRIEGLADAAPAPGVIEAIRDADLIVIAPSSPIVSIGTILGVAGVREAVAARRDRVIGVSPIIGGVPVEGPAHKFLRGAGYAECSARQMAEIYADVCGTFVIDSSDHAEVAAIEELGVQPVLTDILMPDRAARERLARTVIETAG